MAKFPKSNPFLGLNTKTGTLHFPPNLLVIFASRMDAIYPLSPDCPLARPCDFGLGVGAATGA